MARFRGVLQVVPSDNAQWMIPVKAIQEHPFHRARYNKGDQLIKGGVQFESKGLKMDVHINRVSHSIPELSMKDFFLNMGKPCSTLPVQTKAKAPQCQFQFAIEVGRTACQKAPQVSPCLTDSLCEPAAA